MNFEDLAKKIVESAKDYVEKNRRYPLLFPSANEEIVFRPIVTSDIGLTRVVTYHKIGDLKVACLGKGCPMCSRIEQILEYDEDAWYGPSEVGLMQVYIVRGKFASDRGLSSDSDFFATLGFRKKSFIRVNEFFSNLNLDMVYALLDKSGPVIVLQTDSDGKVTMKLGDETVETPPIPEDFPKLDTVWIGEPTESDINNAMSKLDRILEKVRGGAVQPRAVPMPKAQPEAKPSANTPSNQASGDEGAKPNCFGKEWKLCQECLLCPYEEECRNICKEAKK